MSIEIILPTMYSLSLIITIPHIISLYNSKIPILYLSAHYLTQSFDALSHYHAVKSPFICILYLY
jgi:hypothetical protein